MPKYIRALRVIQVVSLVLHERASWGGDHAVMRSAQHDP